MSREEANEVQMRLAAAEQALAAKQQHIDEMKQELFQKEKELETVSVFKAQVCAWELGTEWGVGGFPPLLVLIFSSCGNSHPCIHLSGCLSVLSTYVSLYLSVH